MDATGQINDKRSFTAEEDAFLRENREKYSTAIMGEMLGRTKNSVVGRCHRLKIKLSPEKKRAAWSEAGKKRALKLNSAVMGFSPMKITRREKGRLPPMFMREPPVMILDGVGVKIGLLEDHHCKWVVGEPKDMTCCGQERRENSPYCAAHHSIAYMDK